MAQTVSIRARRKQYLVRGQQVQQVDARELQSVLGTAKTEGPDEARGNRAVPDAARWTARDAWLAGGR
ncbi:MAG TPA: hypothetical protein PKE27_21945 [Povalibacter sp.]|uniref:hypothetical protein n=1 Tax=Povalibacter sp. TaxID=1962978 RepID=UPI002C80B8BA|nr:hypothetical protein [Povalibacter sp.]HMN47256.1 hypothetical protein [Povalibacter sp.]